MSIVNVCVPAYEMYGVGYLYIRELLESVSIQEAVNYSVVVSDQSTDDKVKKVCQEYDFVEYHYFDGPRNACDNLNHALTKCTGDIVKILFADDFLVDDIESLYRCVEPIMNEETFWTATSCLHTYDSGANVTRPLTPFYHTNIHMGVNTMSSPSIISFRNDKKNPIMFDPNVKLLLDVDWYKRMELEHGEPRIVETFNVINRMHEKQLQNTECADESVLRNEQLYIIEKYERICGT